MRIFVSEFICGGALAGTPLPDSLRREGRAMLCAIVDDLLRVPACRVAMTLDARLLDDAMSHISDACEVVAIGDPADERREFDRLALSSDAVLVIAPETDDILVERVRRVEALGTRSLNCSLESIKLCGDKLRLAEHLERHAIPTIPTTLADFNRDEPPASRSGSWVIKPCDGAGSTLIHLIADGVWRKSWLRAERAYEEAGILHKALIQPFLVGLPLSVSCLCEQNGQVEIFPIGRQHLSVALQYLGGSIPAELSRDTTEAIERLVRSACATIPGLSGYVGFDLLLPETNSILPLIVEINPRLTTSYVGYRQLCSSNIAERWLQSALPNCDPTASSLDWKEGRIEFISSGSDTLCCED